jgi:chorismate mutase
MPTSPSSASNTKLGELRDSLRDLNQQIFKLILERRSLVEQIQQQKTHVDGFASFDLQRELQFFQELKPVLSKLSLQELMAFSLLMEGQAGAPIKYPAWSEGVHLLEAPSHNEHRLNPILLKILLPEAFATLKLTSHFGFLRSI